MDGQDNIPFDTQFVNSFFDGNLDVNEALQINISPEELQSIFLTTESTLLQQQGQDNLSPLNGLDVNRDSDEDTFVKKKELAKKSEARRRNRFNERLSEIKDIVPTIKGDKVTKEIILENSIKYIRELQQEVSLLRAHKRMRVEPILSAVPSSREELCIAFRKMQETCFDMPFTAAGFGSVSHMLDKMAADIDNMEYILQAQVFKLVYILTCTLDVNTLFDVCDSALKTYRDTQKFRKENSIPCVPLTWFGYDIVCWVYAILRFGCFISGRVDEYYEKSNKTVEWATQLNHQPTFNFALLTERLHRTMKGYTESIVEAKKMVDSLSAPTAKAAATLVLGFSLIHASKLPEDQKAGLQLILTAGDYVKGWADNWDLITADLVLHALNKCQDYKYGLQYVEQAIERANRTGLNSNLTDLIVKKAELLGLKADHQGDESLNQEAARLLTTAIEYAKKRPELRGRQWKYSLLAARRWKKLGNQPALDNLKPGFLILIQHFSEKARKYLDLEEIKYLLGDEVEVKEPGVLCC